MTIRNSLEQSRARVAHQCAEKASENKEKSKEYKQLAKKYPMLIKVNGLGSALAFSYAKGKGEHKMIYDDLKKWLLDTDSPVKEMLEAVKDKDDLSTKVIYLNSQEYRAVTVEAMAFLTWLRRFADGLIED